MANELYSGGMLAPGNNDVNNGVVEQFYRNCGHAPETMGGANPLIARLAGGIIGEINHMERPDQYMPTEIDEELKIRRMQLGNMVQGMANKMREEAMRQKLHVAQHDMDELDILLNNPAPGAPARRKPIRINSQPNNGSSLSDAYADLTSDITTEQQLDLPLFNSGGGLTPADRAFLRDLFGELSSRLDRLELALTEIKNSTVLPTEEFKSPENNIENKEEFLTFGDDDDEQ